MTELILVRHGETAWNAERRLQGHIDTPLSDEGERQARAMAAALAAIGVDRVVASDLKRAHDTARPVGELLGLPVTTDARLRERCFGAFEGLLYDEIQHRFPQAWTQWQARELDARFPQGDRVAETLTEFRARVAAALEDLARAGQGKTIAVVSHGGFLDCAYRIATGMDMRAPRNFDVRNASINRFAWSGAGLQLRHWGDVSHLGEVLDELR